LSLPAQDDFVLARPTRTTTSIDDLPSCIYKEFRTGEGSLSSRPLHIVLRLSPTVFDYCTWQQRGFAKVRLERHRRPNELVEYYDERNDVVKTVQPKVVKWELHSADKSLSLYVYRKSLPISNAHGGVPFVFAITIESDTVRSSPVVIRSKESL
jgi:hypothetical protein